MGFYLGKMNDTLLSKIETLKQQEKKIAEEIAELEDKKSKQKEDLQKQLNDTLKELLLEEKKRFLEAQKNDSIDDFLNQTQDVAEKLSMQSIDTSIYDSIKSVTEKPYDLWSSSEKEFVENVSYQLNKLKDSYSDNNVVLRTESLLKKDNDDLYRV
jgi:hypothetical protein